jgi:hypothetical protein
MDFAHSGVPFAIFTLGIAVPGPAGKDDGAIRPAAVAGQFYPESLTILKLSIEKFLRDALPAQAEEPVAIVVPHAGYIFSGQICADGYNQARGQDYETIVILGTNHTAPQLRKIALYPAGFRPPRRRPGGRDAAAALIAASPAAADAPPAANIRSRSRSLSRSSSPRR